MEQAFKLRGEDHIHEDHREREGEQKLIERPFELTAAADDGGGVSGGHVHRRGGFEPRGVSRGFSVVTIPFCVM